MAVTSVSAKGQVVIPKKVREVLGLKPGDKLLVSVEGEAIILKPLREKDITRLWGKYRGIPLLDDLEAEHRAELIRR
ncbi:AbrB/MazE/SpoVT family DNA-binding domain-containing protein [Candidatus Bipolaricaulota bacterium]|nr:AbrB/MazE/SpoVT family DNA-binding domain-containing protein [Candidatus Bipolaricaulota bacterium]